jgi:DeoR/GlpR family transcriptional regulator of sugar metabolism
METTVRFAMISEIQQKIMSLLVDNKGEISNKELQKSLEIGLSTLYTYLDELSGLCIKRKWGGLEITPQSRDGFKSVFQEKLSADRKEKEGLAFYIVNAGFLKRGDVILMDCGTTNYIIAENMVEQELKGLDIITVNPYVLNELLKYPAIGKVSVVGGMLNWSDGSILGPQTVESLKNVAEIGTLIVGIDALDKEGEIGINDPLEVEQKKVMIDKAKRILIPITQNKLDRAIAYSVGNIKKLKKEKDVSIFLPGKHAEADELAKDMLSILGKEHFIFTGDPNK